MHAQAEATRACEREILRLVDRYGADTVETAFGEVQNYVERLTRARIAALPDVEWETVDYLDLDPAGGEGLIPIRVKMTISGDRVHYDLNGSHPAVGSFLNSGYGATTSARRTRARRRSSPTCRSTPASTARSRSTSARRAASSTRRGRSRSPASAPGRTRRS